MKIYVVFYYYGSIDSDRPIRAFRDEDDAEEFKDSIRLESPEDAVYWKQVELVE